MSDAQHLTALALSQQAEALAAAEGITELQAYRQLQALRYLRRR